MYFDSWSTSYFFWIIVCFAVWAFAGFSVYGAINVFTSRRGRYKKSKNISFERIQELKKKAERGTDNFSYSDDQGRTYEQEKEETIKCVEAFINRSGGIEKEKEEVSVPGENVWRKKEEGEDKRPEEDFRKNYSGKEKTEQDKLFEIYIKEQIQAREQEEKQIAENIQKIEREALVEGEISGEDIKEECPEAEGDFPEDRKIEQENRKWKEIDEVFRVAFRRG